MTYMYGIAITFAVISYYKLNKFISQYKKQEKMKKFLRHILFDFFHKFDFI